MKMMALISLAFLQFSQAMTKITVINQWDGGALKHSDVNVKIKGEVSNDSGRKPITLQCCFVWPRGLVVVISYCTQTQPTAKIANACGVRTCDANFEGSQYVFKTGTLHYKFHALIPSPTSYSSNNVSTPSIEVPLCDDVKGLGNCYGKEYKCVISQDKLCHCSEQ
jgi:hypothetical protein